MNFKDYLNPKTSGVSYPVDSIDALIKMCNDQAKKIEELEAKLDTVYNFFNKYGLGNNDEICIKSLDNAIKELAELYKQ